MKRKRRGRSDDGDQPNKKRHRDPRRVTHPVLEKYYHSVTSLRDYLLAALPSASKNRRQILKRRIRGSSDTEADPDPVSCAYALLDDVFVCSTKTAGDADARIEPADRLHFSQQYAISSGGTPSKSQTPSQAELVDLVIWVLFKRLTGEEHRPQHILCHGITKTYDQNQHEQHEQWTIPGFATTFRNEYVDELKGLAWVELLELLGGHGQIMMTSMLLNCSLYRPLNGCIGNLYQLSGRPLPQELLLSVKGKDEERKPLLSKMRSSLESKPRAVQPSDIRLVRQRMLYAKASLNGRGKATFGLRHIHVLNRFPNPAKRDHTVHIMKYIFPRQYGLHNVFTSRTDSKETTQPFKDYTLREEEIEQKDYTRHTAGLSTTHLPKRLRGVCFAIIQRLQRLHDRCSYSQVLAHHCPSSPLPSLECSANDSDIAEIASKHVNVSAFARAVIRQVWPMELLGIGLDGEYNWSLLMRSVDAFIRSRRFESISLDSIIAGMKVNSIDWLRPPNSSRDHKVAMSDHIKRREILAELIYYIFDSFLIPLIRSNFHVTESSQHRNRLLYFRHNMWRRLTEPALLSLKTSMLEEMPHNLAMSKLSRRALGFSQIRLLPKAKGMRPIANLKRRAQILRNGRVTLGRSINSVLAPVFNVLNYEKTSQPSKLGSSLFSVSGIFDRLQGFRSTLLNLGLASSKLYFVKVDVQGAFDNIPQAAVQQLIAGLLSEDHYYIKRHTEFKPPDTYGAHNADVIFKPTRKFCSEAAADFSAATFIKAIAARPPQSRRHNTVYVDGVVPDTHRRSYILELLSEHIGANVVRIGKKFYRQKKGIPQGSVLSSLLCNLFYGGFEAEHLGFLQEERSLLMRLIDDFLLITTDKKKATRFLQIMHDGSPEHGICIKPEKSLANFGAKINRHTVPELASGKTFPYCGILLDQKNLNILKDYSSSRAGGTMASDGLTVEYSRAPGQNIRRKTLTSLKLQLQTMLLSTAYNSRHTVVSNVYNCMFEVARKTIAYIKNVTKDESRISKSLQGIVENVIALAVAMMKSSRNKLRCAKYQCSISRTLLQCLTYQAFIAVFGTRQTLHRHFVDWLNSVLAGVVVKCTRKECLWLNGLASRSRDKKQKTVKAADGRTPLHA